MFSQRLKIAFWTTMAVAILLHGDNVDAKCRPNNSLVRQIQVGYSTPPRFKVQVENPCPTCPAINIHVRCGNFQQRLADPRVFRVLGYDDCVVYGGRPLSAMQSVSFTYAHDKFPMALKYSDLLCE